MKKIFFISIIVSILSVVGILSSCSNMNDMHDKYLRDGETTYVGRVDSVLYSAGRERVKIHYWVTDPRVKELRLLWNQKRDSLVVPVPEHQPLDALEVIIGDGKGVIAEGNHNFFFFSHDNRGHRSVVFETLINVYGQQYQDRILSRSVIETQVADNDVTVVFSGASSNEEVGIEMTYTNLDNKTITAFFPDAGTEIKLQNVDFSKGLSFQTLYLPEPTAIDTFRTTAERIPIVQITNVAQGKPVTCSDILTPTEPTQQPQNAVDGNTAYTSGRWVSTANGEHWLEIDLLGEYTVSSFKTWNGQGSGYGNPIARMKLQVWNDGAWLDVHEVTGNTDPLYGASFEPITTTRIRLYCYNQTRLFELAVYSIIRY
ncbi:MAG: discoidin domain-containing protein [Tannerella sp.]|jgi:hypothetical protein|nr:discoidin domain-containing protein [Tannerella sp.]